MNDSVFRRPGVLAKAVEALTGQHVRPGQRKLRIPCPVHNGEGTNCALDFEKNVYSCFSGCRNGSGVADFIIGCGKARDRAEAARWLETQLGESPPLASAVSSNGRVKQRVVASFFYTDERGSPVARVDRVEPGRNGRPKEFLPSLWQGNNYAARPGLHGKTLPLYRLGEVRDAVASGARVWLVEGEGKCDVLRAALREADDPPDAATTIAVISPCLSTRSSFLRDRRR